MCAMAKVSNDSDSVAGCSCRCSGKSIVMENSHAFKRIISIICGCPECFISCLGLAVHDDNRVCCLIGQGSECGGYIAETDRSY